ncbi:MAG: ABC transporter permease [Symploca sp. SIO2G7]|nr:ABC transporter permease [Symploca sp. SIO2G7]
MGQTLSISLQNLRSLPSRLGPSLVAIIGVAGVVLVLVAVLSMANGFRETLGGSALEDNVIVLRSGSTSELDSGFGGDQSRLITQSEELALSSRELFVMVDIAKAGTSNMSNVPFRGVEAQAPELRKDFQIVEGRMFEPGRKQLIAGIGAAGQFEGLETGNTLEFGTERWEVVGLFSASGGAAESELWTDAPVLQGAYRRGNGFSIVYGQLKDTERFAAFRDSLTNDPRLSVQVERETEYLAEQSAFLSGFISIIGYSIAILMALGALFGALNTMYSAVSDRSREIATLRALGFAPRSILVSVMLEAFVLALIGGIIGGVLAYLLFNGLTVSTLNFTSFTQVVFAFAVTPDLLVQGIILALVIGLIGGFAPAIRAARMPIVTALRE